MHNRLKWFWRSGLGFGVVPIVALGIVVNSVTGFAAVSISLKQVAEGFTSPMVLVPYDATSGRLLVADQPGTIHLLDKAGKEADKLFLDVRDRMKTLNQGFDERGLLGLALHPHFTENRRFFVVYNAPLRKEMPTNWDNTIHVSEFKVFENDRLRADPSSERILLQIDKPYFNHNGGSISFGPDGYLYISVGDGGNANDAGRGHSPQGNGQDTMKLLGKILRIDIDKGEPYSTPSDNPFAKGNGLPEIYAYGMRNPWRISFDRGGTHELFAGDVGQDLFEEVDIIVKGGNYGWNIREGFHCFNAQDTHTPPEDCPKVGADGKPLLDPILEYKNSNFFKKDPEARGISVVGGFVYRGKALPELNGRYVFSDWSRMWAFPQGTVMVATRPAAGSLQAWTVETAQITAPANGKVGAYIVSMGQDAEGELYILTNGSNMPIGKTGKVFKVTPATP